MPPKYSDEDVDDLDDILDEFSAKPPPSKSGPPPPPSSQRNPPAENATISPQPTTSTKGKASDVSNAPAGDDDDTTLSDDFAKEFAKQMEEMMRTLAGAEQTSTGEGGTTDEEDEAKKFKELWEKLITEDLETDSGNSFSPLPPPATGGGQPRAGSQQDPLGSKKSVSSSSNSNSAAEDPYQRTIQEVMDKLRTSNSELQTQSGSNNPAPSEKTLEDLLSSLGDMNLEDGEGENLESVLEGMMSQLMSKEILYEPLKELHDKFPQYLTDNAKELSEADKKRYEEQYKSVDKIIKTFDDPAYSDDDPKYRGLVLEHMNIMQTHGSPPSAIMGEMPPGFDLGEDGLPKVPEGCVVT